MWHASTRTCEQRHSNTTTWNSALRKQIGTNPGLCNESAQTAKTHKSESAGRPPRGLGPPAEGPPPPWGLAEGPGGGARTALGHRRRGDGEGRGGNVILNKFLKYKRKTKMREKSQNQDSTCALPWLHIFYKKQTRKWSHGRYTNFGGRLSQKQGLPSSNKGICFSNITAQTNKSKTIPRPIRSFRMSVVGFSTPSSKKGVCFSKIAARTQRWISDFSKNQY